MEDPNVGSLSGSNVSPLGWVVVNGILFFSFVMFNGRSFVYNEAHYLCICKHNVKIQQQKFTKTKNTVNWSMSV